MLFSSCVYGVYNTICNTGAISRISTYRKIEGFFFVVFFVCFVLSAYACTSYKVSFVMFSIACMINAFY